MNTFTQFWNSELEKARELNHQRLLREIDVRHPSLANKIKRRYESLTRTQRERTSIDDIWERCKTDPIYQSIFAVDAKKQSLDEQLQIKWLMETGRHPNIYKAPASGSGAITFENFVKITGNESKKRNKSGTKSIDAIVDSRTFCILKRTGENGGAQDNQCDDVIRFIEQIRGYLLESGADETYLFYLDGPYYTPELRTQLEAMVPSNLKNRMIITSCESVAMPQASKPDQTGSFS